MLTIYTAQLNPMVGALANNRNFILGYYKQACNAGADIMLTAEMSLTGYSVEDLVLTDAFLADVKEEANKIARATTADNALLFGLPVKHDGKIYNAVALAYAGKIKQWFCKKELPNYGVFDEKRLFDSGVDMWRVFSFKGHTIGVAICEDMWFPQVSQEAKNQGAELILSPNGSPWDMYKYDVRQQTIWQRVKETGLPVIYVNQWGGQDELVFDGNSFALNPDGKVYQARGWGDATALLQFERGKLRALMQDNHGPNINWQDADNAANNHMAALYFAAMTGLRDYVSKVGFNKVLLGLSGGVDSALVATMAVDALGADNVRAVMLPSRFSSGHSVSDAEDLARRQGISALDSVAIQPMVDAQRAALADIIKVEGVTDENLQARTRGLTLMAISNATHAMLLSTGNKSEMSVGYATLYGDMNGGFNPLKDIYKTDAFALCHWRNSLDALNYFKQVDVIPENILTKPPSAELAEGQVDTNSLPPYDVLDAMLKCMIEGQQSAASINAAGKFDYSAEVERIWKMFLRAEHKRRQACPGVKVTPLSFGARDRRFPIVNGWS